MYRKGLDYVVDITGDSTASNNSCIQSHKVEEVSYKALERMDQAVRSFKIGQVSDPADLSDFRGRKVK